MKKNGAILKWILLAGFVAGILLANLAGKENLRKVGTITFSQEQEWRYEGEKAVKNKVCLAERRLLVWTLFWGMGTASAFFVLYWALTFWVGFSFGLVGASAAYVNGIQGCFFVLLAVFPQYIFYILAFFLLYRKRTQKKTINRKDSVRNTRTKHLSKAQCCRIAQRVLENMMLFLIILIGIAIENNLNPLILHAIFSLL